MHDVKETNKICTKHAVDEILECSLNIIEKEQILSLVFWKDLLYTKK